MFPVFALEGGVRGSSGLVVAGWVVNMSGVCGGDCGVLLHKEWEMESTQHTWGPLPQETENILLTPK